MTARQPPAPWGPDRFDTPETAVILAFLRRIGLTIDLGPVPEDVVLPGIAMIPNGLRVDPAYLPYPGDMLHEAGHLAVLTADDRARVTPEMLTDMGGEIAAIAWSWAACRHLDMAPALVFHQDGYRGSSPWFIETFASGAYPGLPLLQWMDLTRDGSRAAEEGVAPFPHMIRWLRA